MLTKVLMFSKVRKYKKIHPKFKHDFKYYYFANGFFFTTSVLMLSTWQRSVVFMQVNFFLF